VNRKFEIDFELRNNKRAVMSNFESNISINQLNQEDTFELVQSDHLNFYNNFIENEPEENCNKIIKYAVDGFEEFEDDHEQTCHLFQDIEKQFFTTFTTESMWPI